MRDVQALRDFVSQPGTRIWTMAGRWPAMGVLFFGSVLLYFAGFSSFPQAHNAAHDTRHASGFPCH